MGRSHDFHCLDCHAWTSGFDLGAEDRCMGCGSTRIEYDPNCDGCSECDIVPNRERLRLTRTKTLAAHMADIIGHIIERLT